jgi:hypothetical protein
MNDPDILAYVNQPDPTYLDPTYLGGFRIVGVRVPAGSWKELHEGTEWLRTQLIKARGSLANNLCPDHRDKQYGKPCLACEIERLEKQCAKLREALDRAHSRLMLFDTMAEDPKKQAP